MEVGTSSLLAAWCRRKARRLVLQPAEEQPRLADHVADIAELHRETKHLHLWGDSPSAAQPAAPSELPERGGGPAAEAMAALLASRKARRLAEALLATPGAAAAVRPCGSPAPLYPIALAAQLASTSLVLSRPPPTQPHAAAAHLSTDLTLPRNSALQERER